MLVAILAYAWKSQTFLIMKGKYHNAAFSSFSAYMRFVLSSNFNIIAIKRLIGICVLTSMTVSDACAQTIFTQFYDADDIPSSEASCYYYRKGLINATGYYQDTVKSFYCVTNTLRSIEVYDNKGNANGLVRLFYKSGQLKERANYKDGLRFGHATTYYRNGRVQLIRIYPDKKNIHTETPFPYLIAASFDSLGTPEVISMNGVCHYVGSWSGMDVIESGKVVNGLRDSIWTISKNGRVLCAEQYANGGFLHGTAFDGDKKIEYDAFENQPEYDGGMEAMSKFITRNLHYPSDTRRNGIDGKVFCAFVVEKDGSVSNIQVVQSLSLSTDAETIRVIGLMPKWIPGKKRGMPARKSFVLPVRYKIDI